MSGGARERPALFVTRALDVGGAQRQLVVLVNGLARRGRPVIVAVFYGGGELEAELDAGRVQLVDLAKRGRWDPGLFLRRLVGLARRARPSVVHGYLPTGNLAATLAARLGPRARLVWGVRAASIDTSSSVWLPTAVFGATRLLSRLPDLIISNSEAGARFHVSRGYPADRITVVPNGIDLERFRPEPDRAAALRREWGIDARAPVLGFVGRLAAEKGASLFVEAFARAARVRPDVRAVVVASGPPRALAALRADVRRVGVDGSLVLSGPRRDLPAVYSALDVLCLPSRAEGSPNVVAEAMACGTPCVVTDVGDSAHVVGPTGLVVPSHDPEALASAQLELLDAAGPGRPEACRDRIRREFGLERLLDRSEALLWPEAPA